MRIVVDGRPIEAREGDSVAVAIVRAGEHPGHGGCLCLAGDCPSCVATVDGVPYVRTCQVAAQPGLVVVRHPAASPPPAPDPGPGIPVAIRHEHPDVVVIGAGPAGAAAAEEARAAGRDVRVVEALEGDEATGVYPGPLVVVRTDGGMVHLHAREVVVATGAAEIVPACPGAHLPGVVTARAARALLEADVDLGRLVEVRAPAQPVRIEGTDRVTGVVVRDDDGTERTLRCDTVVAALGVVPRDGLARQGAGLPVRAVGDAALPGTLPPVPAEGVVCPCTGATVADLESVWERGFHDMELFKRATLAGTGTCQGSACTPYLRSFIAAKGAAPPAPFTARPLARQVTLEEAAAGFHHAPVRRTALDGEHRRLGARMERMGGWWRPWHYGDRDAEYWAVREGVSICDVGTLGRFVVAGPDAVAFLERLFPCRVADLGVGRIRYALLLDERGYVIDDGVILRESERRFWLTFTTGGTAFADPWMRDWAEDGGHDVRIVDRTAALGAINVTGPHAATLLGRLGLAEPPAFMRAVDADVAGVPCRVVRLGFTGEASFELHHAADRSVGLWRALLEAGVDLGARPHGLDTLLTARLEKGHVIVGIDTDFDSTPRRLDMAWAARMDKPDFIGRHALQRTDVEPLDRQLVGLALEGPCPDEGAVLWKDGAMVGYLTSARHSPALGHPVALAWLRLVDGVLPAEVVCEGRPARRVPLPFYDREGERARA